MGGGTKTFSFSRWPEAARWGACFALAVAFHAVGAAALFARWSEDSDLVANAPVIMVDLAPVAVSPNITPTEVPTGPQQQEAEPEPQPEKPIEKIELPPDPQAEPVVAMPPPKPVEKPKEKKPKQKHASLASAPSTADQQADAAGRADAGRLVAQFQRDAELEVATRGRARAPEEISIGGARRPRHRAACLQRRSSGRCA